MKKKHLASLGASTPLSFNLQKSQALDKDATPSIKLNPDTSEISVSQPNKEMRWFA
jgi:hypothetical protein